MHDEWRRFVGGATLDGAWRSRFRCDARDAAADSAMRRSAQQRAARQRAAKRRAVK
ncbi:aminotransferase [Burkholderia pseudomallei]|nr:aminotransferase [Burkholderia pseudomallei]OMU93880.1 aminotransferase [Burkholderia pseudomallei]OMV05703.1 aminotransferase [Burkholderia pseudomallei]OMW36094.1 aminotransferase [Burkholderia pseudomallei]OMW58888.1 aminotransferase [Burkholderia pseudomallei]